MGVRGGNSNRGAEGYGDMSDKGKPFETWAVVDLLRGPRRLRGDGRWSECSHRVPPSAARRPEGAAMSGEHIDRWEAEQQRAMDKLGMKIDEAMRTVDGHFTVSDHEAAIIRFRPSRWSWFRYSLGCGWRCFVAKWRARP